MRSAHLMQAEKKQRPFRRLFWSLGQAGVGILPPGEHAFRYHGKLLTALNLVQRLHEQGPIGEGDFHFISHGEPQPYPRPL